MISKKESTDFKYTRVDIKQDSLENILLNEKEYAEIIVFIELDKNIENNNASIRGYIRNIKG